jgi:hypothetical protein
MVLASTFTGFPSAMAALMEASSFELNVPIRIFASCLDSRVEFPRRMAR